MPKTIEKILDDFVVPEMEYDSKYEKGKTKSKSKKKSISVTIDDVPEVVLPKTKAEVYNEAKDRLTQKTSASSKKKSKNRLFEKVKTVELEIAAVSEATSNSDARREAAMKPVAEPKWVGGADELIPFAWRNPLIADIDRPSKIYRQVLREAKELLLPALRER